jgi:type I restriction enzyme S subunit
MEGLNMGIIKELPVWLPSLATQNEILAKLKTLEDGVQSLRSFYDQKLEALSELKQAILSKAFAAGLTARSADELPEAAE